ncbi:MAG: oxidoreductase [Candidatus Omnitrophota bacterium]
MKKKIKVALYWCSSCGGCEESVIDLAEDLIKVTENIEIVFWPIAIDVKYEDLASFKDREIDAALINGAIRVKEQEEISKLLRKKSKIVIAQGSCAHTGGVVGLANFYAKDKIVEKAYKKADALNNPDGDVPEASKKDLFGTLKTLDQTIKVDYYIPGCPPTPKLIKEALLAVINGTLPAKGSVLAGKKALCDTCRLNDTKPEKIKIDKFKRLHETEWDADRCFLDQGIICMGPATRGGCEARCIEGNFPCRGCFGPVDGVNDHGAKGISMLASMIDTEDEDKIKSIIGSIPDKSGLLYRYGLASSIFRKKHGKDKK